MKNEFYHIYHISFLETLFKGLAEAGTSADALISGTSIKKYNLEAVDTYIPMSAVYEFLCIVNEKLYIENLAEEFYSNVELSSLGDYGEMLMSCPDLYTLIANGIKYESQIQTNTRLYLDISGHYSRLSQIHLDPTSKGRDHAEDMAFAMAIQAFKFILGSDWTPTELHIKGNSGGWLESMFNGTDICTKYGYQHYALVFETSLLSSKSVYRSNGEPDFNYPIETFSDRIKRSVASFKAGYIPTLTDFATQMDVSNRTVQRKLELENENFNDLIQQHLFKKSLEILKDENLPIVEISETLGYANAPNFIRAFKKWTNCTPAEYREQIA